MAEIRTEHDVSDVTRTLKHVIEDVAVPMLKAQGVDSDVAYSVAHLLARDVSNRLSFGLSFSLTDME